MTVHALRVPGPGATAQLTTGAGRIVGFSAAETSNSASAAFRLWDAQGAAANLLMTMTLSAGQSVGDSFAGHPWPFYSGVYFDLVSGAVEAVIYVDYHDPSLEHPIPVVLAFTEPLALALALSGGGAS